MSYIFAKLWIPLALAFTLGALVAWSACKVEPEKSEDENPSWLILAAIIVAIAALLAALGWLPGALGIGLEVGLALFAAYIVGCGIACRLYLVVAADRARLDKPPSH